MFRLYKNIFLGFILFLGCTLQSFSKAAAPVKAYHNGEYIRIQEDAASVQNNTTPFQKDNIVFFRAHHGIDESSSHFSRNNKNIQIYLSVKNSSYEVSHYFWNILSVHREPPRHLDFSSVSSLRAPPFC